MRIPKIPAKGQSPRFTRPRRFFFIGGKPVALESTSCDAAYPIRVGRSLSAVAPALFALILLLLALFFGSCSSSPTGNPALSGNESGAAESSPSAGTAASTESGGNDTETQTPSGGERAVKRVLLIAGQSNAVGNTFAKFLPDAAGKISSERVEEMKAGYPNIRIMYCTNPTNPGTRVMDSSEDFVPVTFGYGVKDRSPIGTTFGPEVGLAEYLNKTYPGEEFYLIKCATGGSNLAFNWNPTDRAKDNLYRQMVDFTEKSLALLEADGSHAEIEGFLWMQGEADAPSRLEGYNALFRLLVTDFEKTFRENLPQGGMAVIQAGISDFWSGHDWLNKQKQNYAKQYENAYYFSTYDLTYRLDNDDYAHFDAAAMVLLGNRFGETMTKHWEGKSGTQ